MNKNLIIKCAKKKGFKLPKRIKVPYTVYEDNKLHQKYKWIKLSYKDIVVHRGITNFSKDLGE